MDCSRFEERLDDWIDGAADESGSEAMERHASECERCRRAEQTARLLRHEVAQLPRGIAPPRDLLPGIRARISPRALARPSGVRWGALAASVLLATLSLAIVYRSWNGSGEPGLAAPAPGGALPASSASLAELEAEYERAVLTLLASIEQREEALSSETRQLVQRNLVLIDGAIEEIRAALGRDPGPDKERLLTAVYRQKIDLLWKVSKLSSLEEGGEGQDHAI